jgi:hypothetical protein
MSFRIKSLSAECFTPSFALSDEELAARSIVCRIADDQTPGYPCRVGLTNSRPGDKLLLLNYEHHANASPYCMRFAIYVRCGEEIYDAIEQVLEQLRICTLVVRAFDADDMMVG